MQEPQVDWLAAGVLLSLSILASWLTWGRMYDPILDQGWYMQVSARVMAGEVLYRDVIWMYPPLSVYLLGWLFQVLGIDATALLVLQHTLAAVGCLLTYRIARFLLPARWALLGTVAVFAGGWWGGFVGYAFAYTGSVPLGAVLGLVLVVSLLSYVARGGFGWLVMAGFVTAAALLTKPEYALACLGTGLAFLAVLLWYPAGLDRSRRDALRALSFYIVPTVATTGLGYAALIVHAGWPDVWAGISGYDQDAILLQTWPIWGTPRSWGAIASGMGLYLLAVLACVGVMSPAAARRRGRRMALLAGLGLGLAGLPWAVLFVIQPGFVSAIASSELALLQEALRIVWAPGTVLLSVVIVILGLRWWQARRHGSRIQQVEWVIGLLAVYSVLPPARSYLHPIGTFHFQYLDTLLPLLLFVAVGLMPTFVEQRWPFEVHRSRLGRLVALGLAVYTVAGLAWSAAYVSLVRTDLASPRGSVRYQADTDRRRPWAGLLTHILAHTEPGETIAILGPEPGTYFWSARRNPLRHDSVLPRMATSPDDAREIVRRLEAEKPRLVIVSQSVKAGRGWFWDLEVGREAYADLAPVWLYVDAHYQVGAQIGDDEWGYVVYEPRPGSP